MPFGWSTMSSEYSVYQTRFSVALYSLGCAVLSGVMLFVALGTALRAVSFVNWLLVVGMGLFGLILALGSWSYWRSKGSSRLLARFDGNGFTDEYGTNFGWQDIQRIYLFTGVLFIKSNTDKDWVLRLDPAEIGYKSKRDLITFLKLNAPESLTQEL